MIGVSSSSKSDKGIKVKIENMKRRERSSSRDSSRYRRKRNRSSYSRYDDSSDERGSPDRTRRYSRVRSPTSPHSRYGYEKSHRDEYGASREVEKAHPYKVLCVSALHSKASDEVIKDALYNEYKKFGDLSVKVSNDLEERVAYVCFRNSEDARDAKHAKPRIIIYDKVALVEPVPYESRTSVERHHHRRPRSRSYSPEFDRYYRRSPLPDPYRADRVYERIPYAPLPIIRDFRRDLPPVPHPEFLPRPPLHPALPPVPLNLPHGPPHLYLPPRPFIPFKPPHAHFIDKLEKKDKFPNYLHHVPPEDDPLATRTLFAGNLELSITEDELRRIFSRYGVVEDVDIKRPMPGTGNAYAFVRYKNLDMAHRAKVELSGQYIGKFQCKIGYGKATPTTRIWVGGLGPWTSTAQLEREFDRFGAIKKIDYDKSENSAYILYDSIDAATAAVKEMRGFPLGGPEHKLRVDFADIGSRQPRPPPPPSAYDDVASGAGDYRVGMSGADELPYEPWTGGNDYEYEQPGIPPGVTLWSDRKAEKESYGRSTHSPNHYSPKEERDRDREYEGGAHRYKRMRSSCNSESDSETSRFNGALATARSLADITRCTTNAWQGALILKSSLFPAKFHITDGDGNIINVLMKSDESKHLLKISQRLRLDPAKLEDVSKRILSSPGYGIFVGLPGPSSSIFFDETTAQLRPLRNLVTYLKQKEAAGVISLFNTDTEASGVLYAFPPCQYAADLLKRTAHGMSAEALKEDHLMIVVVKGGSV